MARTSSKDLDNVARHLSAMAGKPYTVGWAYGRPRLYTDGESTEVSPRLPSGQLLEWMYAFAKGFDTGYKAGVRDGGGDIRDIRPRGNPRPRRTMRRKRLIRDVQFFRGHAGGVVGRATQGALDLARAEREMKKRGWVVTWEPDQDADLSWMDDEERAKDHEVWGAILWDRDPVNMQARTPRERKAQQLASLWGIVDPDTKYQRVVEAELASEALSRG